MARRWGHTEEQILAALWQAVAGTTVVELCRQIGITEQTFHTWKRKYAGLGLSELRELRLLREENMKLKRLVADLSLDRHMLQEIVRKKVYGLGTGVRSHVGRSRPIRSASAGSRGCCGWPGQVIVILFMQVFLCVLIQLFDSGASEPMETGRGKTTGFVI